MKNIFAALLGIAFMACSVNAEIPASLRGQLGSIVNKSGLDTGVALSYQGDTLTINGERVYPMMSVYKFPLAMAAARYMDLAGIKLSDSITVACSDLHPSTWSPMRDALCNGNDTITLSWESILEYTIAQSDNNTCEMLFNLVGSPEYVQDYLTEIGIKDINVGNTELEMLENHDLCYANSATPLAAVRLLDMFESEIRHTSPAMKVLADIMEQCRTGLDRIAAPLTDTGAILAHKTGSGFITPEGIVTAHNDIGYVILPDGRKYSVAVFIRDTPLSLEETSRVIASISEAVYKALSQAEQ